MPKKFFGNIRFLIATHVTLLAFLSFARLVLYFSYRDAMLSGSQTLSSVFPAFVRGLWFDNVVACYVMLPALALLVVTSVCCVFARWTRVAAQVWLTVGGIFAFCIAIGDVPYFNYFFKHLNSSIFQWTSDASTAAKMIVGERSYWFYVLLSIVGSIALAWIYNRYRRWADRKIAKADDGAKNWKKIACVLLSGLALIGLCIFGIRGRTGYNPIKISQAYYCKDPFLNQLGIAPTFNLLTSVLDDHRRENKEYHLMPTNDAITLVRSDLGLTEPCDSQHIVRREVSFSNEIKTQPNVVVILMESMSASLLQTFGQSKALTPVLDSLYRQSTSNATTDGVMAFTRCYSAGIHTNHGLTASLYGLPAVMKRNLMKGTVTPHRRGLPNYLHDLGYQTMFFMTHESQYDNMNAFFRTNGYDEVYGEEHYPREKRVNAFGVSDDFLFDFAFRKIQDKARSSKPFFATLLTITNHPPFVVPDYFKSPFSEPEDQVVAYADACIGKFLQRARAEKWYDNTIFVVLGDHGKIVGKSKTELPESYNHIPLLIFGHPVASKQYDGLAGQIDVTPTIMSLLRRSYVDDSFGVDLLSHRRDMLFYSADNQLVARSDSALYIYVPELQKSFTYPLSTQQQAGASIDWNEMRNYIFAYYQTMAYLLHRESKAVEVRQKNTKN